MKEEKKKILIIDDDKFLLDMYALKFGKNNFDVRTAPSGVAAVSALKDGFSPDIILLDLVMPLMDGFSVYEEIKKNRLASHAIAIMLTNQSMPSDVSRARDLGVAGYIVKATTVPSEVVEQVSHIYEKTAGKK
ncbi:MAG: response regulator [Patescibacteria group bacterium]|nr:response regulator [Patescibacteria group bacterium]MDE1945626.1 response regulator [Patescibacteria group bacterium]